jgi:demethylmenaquinone methyltransferase/2-methoxy-6-polyprenyl-1,4-benzoquinol methylase
MSDYEDQLRKSHRLTGDVVQQAIQILKLPSGSCGLDAGCGIGQPLLRLGQTVGPQGKVTGLDRSARLLACAREAAQQSGMPERFDFKIGDLTDPPFTDNTFDWIWCKDSFWPGPQSAGLLGDDPLAGLREFARVVRPGGTIALLYWSSQQLLPGYPELEARLLAAFTATAPYLRGVRPDRHFLCALGWLREVGLVEVKAHSLAITVQAPLDPELQEAIGSCLDMFCEDLQSHVTAADWRQYLALRDPTSDGCILRRPDYYGLVTYALFRGRVPGWERPKRQHGPRPGPVPPARFRMRGEDQMSPFSFCSSISSIKSSRSISISRSSMPPRNLTIRARSISPTTFTKAAWSSASKAMIIRPAIRSSL